jgi:flagellar transcriptional activator FlhD
MTGEQIASEIREANLGYLMLAQVLIRRDRPEPLFRLGIEGASANLIAALTPAQLLRLNAGNTLLCRLRAGDDMFWQLLTTTRCPSMAVRYRTCMWPS